MGSGRQQHAHDLHHSGNDGCNDVDWASATIANAANSIHVNLYRKAAATLAYVPYDHIESET